MSLLAFGLILASVFLHAAWHFISKSRRPAPAFFLLISGSGLLFTLPFTLASGIRIGDLPPEFFWMVLGGGLSGTLCDLGLSLAYRRADVSLAYPLARALPVLLTAAVTLLAGFGRPPGGVALGGMAVISAGCLLMPLQHFSEISFRSYWNRALLGILIAAVGTTGYTIFDSRGLHYIHEYGGVSRLMGSVAYSTMREVVLFSSLGIYCLAVPGERRGFSAALFRQPYPYLAGVFSATAYLLVLLAMGFVTNVSYVQAFRQMSLPVGVLLGVWILKEKCGPAKLTGIVLVVGGLIITALGS